MHRRRSRRGLARRSRGDRAALYLDEVERARAIVAAADLDDPARLPPSQPTTLRGILVHMVQETARHLGHADIIRETIDGATGN